MLQIVTDSTSYLPADIIARYNIPIIPLKVQFGQESYDETDLNSTDFYARLRTTGEFPTTSQPNSNEFLAVYQTILAETPATKILVPTLSSKLSGTYHAALGAARQLPEADITVFDTHSAAMGLGLMVLNAAQMAESGQPLPAIIRRLEEMRHNMRIVLVVDTLEYLKRGGRIGAAAAFLGTLLNTKPILTLLDGQLQPLDRVRTKKKALDRLLAELHQTVSGPDQPVHLGIMHVAAEAEMEKLAETIRQQFNIAHFFASELGPVIGAHVGPGALGVGIFPEPVRP